MIKDFLQNAQPAIPDLLPIGSINKLAEEHNIARTNVSKMLRGEFGDEARLIELTESALKLIENHAKSSEEYVTLLRKQLLGVTQTSI